MLRIAKKVLVSLFLIFSGKKENKNQCIIWYPFVSFGGGSKKKMGADAHQVVEPLLLHDERQGARHVVGGDRVKPQPEDPCKTKKYP